MTYFKSFIVRKNAWPFAMTKYDYKLYVELQFSVTAVVFLIVSSFITVNIKFNKFSVLISISCSFYLTFLWNWSTLIRKRRNGNKKTKTKCVHFPVPSQTSTEIWLSFVMSTLFFWVFFSKCGNICWWHIFIINVLQTNSLRIGAIKRFSNCTIYTTPFIFLEQC